MPILPTATPAAAMTTLPSEDGLTDQWVRWRHQLHRFPETGFNEHKTAGYVAKATPDGYTFLIHHNGMSTAPDGLLLFAQEQSNAIWKLWPDGRAFAGAEDRTCRNWTSGGDGSALVGHHDRNGGGNTSWNSVHKTRGCGMEQLKPTGGDGLMYCFAEK